MRYLAYYASEVDFGILQINEEDEDYDTARTTFEQAHNDLLGEIQKEINKLQKLLKSVRTYKEKDLIRNL
jgi:hypothetical protein